MATDIQLSDLTNSTVVDNGVSDGTGVFDTLMNSVNLYLKDQEESGKLKGTDYANVLLGSMQAVLQQSIQFTLQEKLTEAQIDGVIADIKLKEAELSKTKDLAEAELEQHWGYNVTRDTDNNLILGLLNETGKIDAEKAQIGKQTSNLENQDLLTLAQIGKTKIDADVTAAMGAKDIDLKEAQLVQVSTETDILKQKVVGRKQSTVNAE